MQAWPGYSRSAGVASLLALSIFGFGTGANAAPHAIPILYNDRTVSTKADVLKQGRVLAAMVIGDRLYLPLRSMLEEMGATVSSSAGGKTVTATKSGASVSVTVDKKEVVINGETRPLDVPPMLYKGIVLVPVRVLSEALGAYVLWLPERRVVVVRYNPPAPEPTVAPAPPPTATPAPPPATPAPVPTATPEERTYQGFVEGAFTDPRNYNEFSHGQYCPESYLIDAGYAFKNSPFAIKIDYRQDAYVTSDNLTYNGNHYTRFETIDGGITLTPVFLARQSSADARIEYEIAAPRMYVGIGYLHASNNYGYPQLNGLGFGLEKLPDLRPGIDLSASAFYYPSASGTYRLSNLDSSNAGQQYRQQYRLVKYDVGVALVLKRLPVYVYGGFSGDHYWTKQYAPIAQSHDGPYAGLGVKL